MPTLSKGEESLIVSLKGAANFADALTAIKAVPGRRFNGDTKNWELPLDPRAAERIMVTLKPDVDPDVLDWIKTEKSASAMEVITPLPDDAEIGLPWGDKLHGYQRAFVDYAADNPSIILADDMGLGKTVQALGAAAEFQIRNPEDDKPKLIICPNSVKGVWAREIKKWLGDDEPYVIVNAATPAKRAVQMDEGIAENAWIIVNWEQLRVKKDTEKYRTKVYNNDGEFTGWKDREREVEVLKDPAFELTDWLIVIGDEAHRIKNRKSQTYKGFLRIDGDMKLLLTGTPLQNTPDELWTLLRWLFGKDEYGSYWRFFDTYVDYYEGSFGKIITGVKNVDALRFELSTRLKRRTKDQVLDLPEIVRQYVPITLGSKQRKLYKEAEDKMWFEVAQAAKSGDKAATALIEAGLSGDASKVYQVPNGAARIVRLRQVASTPALLGGDDESAKLDAAVEITVDALPEPIVWFTEFVETANIFAERLRKKKLRVGVFTGATSPEERTQIEDDFQAGDLDVVVGTIAAMKEGVTLTRATVVGFLERSWVPAVNEQCESRVHRQGQKNNVLVLILEAENTVDDGNIRPANVAKEAIVASVITKDSITTKEV